MLEIAQGLTHTCLPTQAESTNLEVLGPTHGLQESSGTAKYRMRCVRACVRERVFLWERNAFKLFVLVLKF